MLKAYAKVSKVGPAAMLLLALVALPACESNPVLVHEKEDEVINVNLAVASAQAEPAPVDHAHVHTLEEVTFHVQVRDQHGKHITGFDTIRVEQRREGTDTWRTAADLHLHGETFSGSYEYATSGAYELRVSGMRHGHGHMSTLHHEHDPLHVARVHQNIGDYRIEFETFPGHIHAGDEVAVRFWVMERNPDPDGVRPPVSELHATIRSEEADGSEESHHASEVEAGVYEATHHFHATGHARVTIRFTTPDGAEVEAAFEPHVAAVH